MDKQEFAAATKIPTFTLDSIPQGIIDLIEPQPCTTEKLLKAVFKYYENQTFHEAAHVYIEELKIDFDKRFLIAPNKEKFVKLILDENDFDSEIEKHYSLHEHPNLEGYRAAQLGKNETVEEYFRNHLNWYVNGMPMWASIPQIGDVIYHVTERIKGYARALFHNYLVEKSRNLSFHNDSKLTTDAQTKAIDAKAQILLLSEIGFFEIEGVKNLNLEQKGLLLSKLLGRNITNLKSHIRNLNRKKTEVPMDQNFVQSEKVKNTVDAILKEINFQKM